MSVMYMRIINKTNSCCHSLGWCRKPSSDEAWTHTDTQTQTNIYLCLLVHMHTHIRLKGEDECAAMDSISLMQYLRINIRKRLDKASDLNSASVYSPLEYYRSCWLVNRIFETRRITWCPETGPDSDRWNWVGGLVCKNDIDVRFVVGKYCNLSSDLTNVFKLYT